MITSNETEYCKVNTTYIAEAEIVKTKRNDIVRKMKKQPVPGFRTGKATDYALRTHYKKEIENNLRQVMLNQANDDILYETKIQPIGQPEVKDVSLVGNDFRCELNYNRKPTFELKQYKDLEVPMPHVKETVEQIIEGFLQTLRNKHGDVRPYTDDEFIQLGDKITMSLETSNSEPKEGELYIVGSNKYPDFDSNILGMKPDDVREFTTIINEEKVTYKVTLHMGLKTVPATLDDALALKCNVKNLKELMDSVSIIANRQYNSEKDEQIAQQIRNQLLASHEIQCPEWLTIMESKGLAAQNQIKWEEADTATKEKYIKFGTDNVKMSLIFDAITREEPDTVLNDSEAIDWIKNFMVDKVQNVEDWANTALKNGTIWGLVAKVKTDYIMKWLIEHVKFVE